ncbi:DUF4262 domain-containing protein [Actinokineospora enzanensis]|uniref:DUF4262 domain-containing protein n=1 Tax=Actinokineospora enzanensis TaxID=155975 RepID=UPI00037F505E|nr:DUF4262 domain-containing protein [Actinokineospora enzanensis]
MSCTCQVCAGTQDEAFVSINEAVVGHGWCVLGVDGGQDEFAYTVGLGHTLDRPEVSMFGLDVEDMQHWLNHVVELSRDNGWPELDQDFTGVIDGVPTRLRQVDPSWGNSLFAASTHFYLGTPPPVLQLVWPDAEGRWPWEEGVDEDCRLAQPHAWLPIEEHPEGTWRLVGELTPGFPFPASPDSWTLTTQSIMDGKRTPVLLVREERAYDVLDERGYDADDLVLAYLGEVVRAHPVLAGAGDVADGAAAALDGDAWVGRERSEDERAAAEKAWQVAGGLDG